MASNQRSQRKSTPSLKEEVRDALLAVLRDPAASPTARAIAGRSLVQLIGDDNDPGDKKRPTELSIEELDEEIAANQQ
jgi:hypothetical protein